MARIFANGKRRAGRAFDYKRYSIYTDDGGGCNRVVGYAPTIAEANWGISKLAKAAGIPRSNFKWSIT